MGWVSEQDKSPDQDLYTAISLFFLSDLSSSLCQCVSTVLVSRAMAQKPAADVDARPDGSPEPVDLRDKDAQQQYDNDHGRKQDGVAQVEAITSVWSKKALWITFAL